MDQYKRMRKMSVKEAFNKETKDIQRAVQKSLGRSQTSKRDGLLANKPNQIEKDQLSNFTNESDGPPLFLEDLTHEMEQITSPKDPIPIHKLKNLKDEVEEIRGDRKQNGVDQFMNYCSIFTSKNVGKWKNTDAEASFITDYRFKLRDLDYFPDLLQMVSEVRPDAFKTHSRNSHGINDVISEEEEVLSFGETSRLIDDDVSETFSNNSNFVGSNFKKSTPSNRRNKKETAFFGNENNAETDLESVVSFTRSHPRKFFRYVFVRGQIKILITTWCMVTAEINLKEAVRNHLTSPVNTLKTQNSLEANLLNIPEPSGASPFKRLQTQIEGRKPSDEFEYKKMYFLKTMKLIDIYEQKHHEVIVEAIPIDSKTKGYDARGLGFNTSTLQWRDNLYFFQRRLQKHGDSNQTYLQLVRMDMTNKLLHLYPLPKYRFYEPMNVCLNSLFSQVLNSETTPEYFSEEEFLNDQILLVQNYPKILNEQKNTSQQFDVYKLCDLDCPMLVKEGYIFKKQMISQLYHIKEKSNNGWENFKLLVIDSTIGEINIKVKQTVRQSALEEMKLRRSTSSLSQSNNHNIVIMDPTYQQENDAPVFIKELDLFSGIVINQPSTATQVLQIQLQISNQQQGMETYYFRIDESNRVLLIYPIPKEKINQVKLIDKIKQSLKLKSTEEDHEFFSTVYIQSNQSPHIRSVGQPTTNLIKMLNFDDEDYQDLNLSNLHFVFGEDKKHQLLAVFDPQNEQRYLTVYYLKNHSYLHCHPSNHLIQHRIADKQEFRLLEEIDNINFMHQLQDNNQSSTIQRSLTSKLRNSSTFDENAQSSVKNKFIPVSARDGENELFSRDTFFPTVKDVFNNKLTDSKEHFFRRYQRAENNTAVVTIKNDRNELQTVKAYSITALKDTVVNPSQHKLDITLEWHCRFLKAAQPKHFFIFCARLCDQSSEIFRNYFMVSKKEQTMERVFKGQATILDLKKKFKFINDDKSLKLMTMKEMQQTVVMSSLHTFEENASATDDCYKTLKLIFPKCPDQRYHTQFISFIMIRKEKKSFKYFISFDLEQQRFQSLGLMMRQKNQNLFHYGMDNFESFTLCQTSDYIGSVRDPSFQQVKYSVFAFFKKELGLIKVRDFLVSRSSTEIEIQLVGMKHLLLSNTVMNSQNFELMANSSFPVPLYKHLPTKRLKQHDDAYQVVKPKESTRVKNTVQRQMIQGCMFILVMSSKCNGQDANGGPCADQKLFSRSKQCNRNQRAKIIRLCERSENHLFQSMSDVMLMGDVKFQLENNDESQFIKIISTQLRAHFIKNKTLNNNESLFLLEQFSQMQIGMRLPDLKYFVTNSFESLKERDFFQKQQLLEGKSISELEINDMSSIAAALQRSREVDKHDKDKLETNSQLYFINEEESYRHKIFHELCFSEQYRIISHDFNLNGTIARALELNASKQIKALLEYILEHENKQIYNNLIMLDLHQIIEARNLDITLFYSRAMLERRLNKQEKICCFESLLNNPDLPSFSNKAIQCEMIKEANIFDDEREQELSQHIIDRKSWIMDGDDRKFKVEHFYINFSMSILKGKVMSKDANHSYEMTHLQLARLLHTKAEQNNIQFFQPESIQRLIDVQWATTKSYLLFVFLIFFFFYFVMFIQICLNPGEQIVLEQNIGYCIFARFFLVMIEGMQIKLNGLGYFDSFWNFIDLGEFIIFIIFLFSQKGILGETFFIEGLYAYSPEIKLVLMMLAFAKLMFFIRIIDKFGLLVRMIATCFYALIPFIVCFVMFLFMFSCMLITLNNQIDSEVVEAEAISFFHKTVLQAFRTSIGELGMPRYPNIIGDETINENQRFLNIYLIWAVWYTQTFTMLVVLLNFIIAVINETYDQVKDNQVLINYQYKAELNLECQEILSILRKNTEFHVILFSVNKNENNQQQDSNQQIIEEVNKFIYSQSIRTKQEFSMVKSIMADLRQSQTSLDQQIRTKFNQLFSRNNYDNFKHDFEDNFKVLFKKQLANKLSEDQGLSSPVPSLLSPKPKSLQQVLVKSPEVKFERLDRDVDEERITEKITEKLNEKFSEKIEEKIDEKFGEVIQLKQNQDQIQQQLRLSQDVFHEQLRTSQMELQSQLKSSQNGLEFQLQSSQSELKKKLKTSQANLNNQLQSTSQALTNQLTETQAQLQQQLIQTQQQLLTHLNKIETNQIAPILKNEEKVKLQSKKIADEVEEVKNQNIDLMKKVMVFAAQNNIQQHVISELQQKIKEQEAQIAEFQQKQVVEINQKQEELKQYFEDLLESRLHAIVVKQEETKLIDSDPISSARSFQINQMTIRTEEELKAHTPCQSEYMSKPLKDKSRTVDRYLLHNTQDNIQQYVTGPKTITSYNSRPNSSVFKFKDSVEGTPMLRGSYATTANASLIGRQMMDDVASDLYMRVSQTQNDKLIYLQKRRERRELKKRQSDDGSSQDH